MEILNFIRKNKELEYEDIKNILEEKYRLNVKMDKSNYYYMVSATNYSDFNNILVRQFTGIILEKNTNNILHYFGEKTYDITNQKNNNLININEINIKNCLISQYIDGYIIKVFYYKEEWRFSTSKHTNAKIFKINGKSLYEIFKKHILDSFETVNSFLYSLDNEYCYSFMLIPEINIYMINKVCLNTLTEYYNFNHFKTLFDIKYKFSKYLIIEKINHKKIRKIHASINDLKNIIYKNKICIFNKTFNN